MEKFNNLYTFIDFAKGNRKYPENTANNLKSALKIFEKVLTEDELNSISLIEDRIEEIFINVINSNKKKNRPDFGRGRFFNSNNKPITTNYKLSCVFYYSVFADNRNFYFSGIF